MAKAEAFVEWEMGPRLNSESVEGKTKLPDPDIIAAEIVEDLQAALAPFVEIAADLKR